MKPLSNTSIAAIFAVGLTLLVWLLLQIPFFKDKETQTTDEMLLLRYTLHQKHAPLHPDPHIVFSGIDQFTLDNLGRWPISRSFHGDFLILLAKESPRTVAWDVFFTEHEKATSAASQPPIAAPPPASSSPADASAPASASPAPAAVVPAAPTANPAPEPAAPSSAPVPVPPSPTPDVPPAPAPPTSPAPADTNSAPTTPAAPAASPTAANLILSSISFGADLPATNAAPATPDASTSSPPAPAQAATGATDNSAPAASPELTEGDQHLVDAASLFPSMVTAAEVSPDASDPKHPQTDESMLPTRPLKHVTGDISKLISGRSAVLPIPELRKETYFGFVNENGESGGGSRDTDPMVVAIGNQVWPSFDLQVLMQYWGIDPDQVTVTLGHSVVIQKPDGTHASIPIDERGQMTLNYRARIEDFKNMNYASLTKGMLDKNNDAKSEERDHLPSIKDNLVIVGVTFNGIDSGPTPLDNNAPLVITHLNALNNILQQDFLKEISPWIWLPIYALFLFATGELMLRVGIAPMIPMGLVAMLLVAGVGFAMMYFANLIVPVAMPEIGILLLAGAVPTKRFFGEEKEKMRVRKAMSAYLSDKVMNKVLANPEGVKLGGVKQVITIMFCDIRGFTAYCDNRDPQEVLNVVNEYFEEMTQVVFKYEGTVDKYIGDCIMAFWNAPEDQPDHAQRAVCCAMEMRYALANFKVKRAGLDTELFECGIGIHTGEALVGNMGSTLKINYTAMGSTVNLGARLEALTKKLNERILISNATREMLTGDFPLTDRGEAIVPGFANPIHVFGVGAEQDLGSAIAVGLKLAKKQDYTAEEVTKPIWAPAPLPEDADPNHGG